MVKIGLLGALLLLPGCLSCQVQVAQIRPLLPVMEPWPQTKPMQDAKTSDDYREALEEYTLELAKQNAMMRAQLETLK